MGLLRYTLAALVILSSVSSASAQMMLVTNITDINRQTGYQAGQTI